MSEIIIYTLPDKQTQVEVTYDGGTIWLNQYQLAELFETDRTSILKHLQNIYASSELDEKSTCAKFAQVRQEGKREVKRDILHYNLDLIISVGYRVNSSKATQFRQWATQRLKDYLVEGYAINEKRLAQKQQEVHMLKDGIRILGRAIEEKANDPENVWLAQFSKGLELLDDYDHEQLDSKGISNQKAKYPEIQEYRKLIDEMKAEFGSDVFGKEKDDSFQGSLMQISKGFRDEDFYQSLEEKAATLLYLVIKNHSFVDGNKRIAAACFLLFLERNDLLTNGNGVPIISNEALASLALFVATSQPEEMETVKKLVISVLNRNQ